MKITWDWSLGSEINHLIQSAHNIGNGFYSLQHFYPLPYITNQKYENIGVYLPDLPYQHLAGFWQKSSQLDDHHLPIVVPPTLTQALQPLISHLNLVPPDITTLKAQYIALLPQVFQFLHATFPAIALPTQIKIYPTYFGTTGSFNWMTPRGEVVIYHRIDQGIRSLVKCTLTSILRPLATKSHQSTWSETEFLVDYLLSSSSLNQLIPQDASYQPTLSLTRGNHIQLAKLSQAFLRKIGAPSFSGHVFTIKNDQIYFGDTLLSTFTNRELKIMQGLLAKSPIPLTLDEIGDLIFTSDDKFSLAAIYQAISRLRHKLDNLGISSSCLATASGIGYYLRN